MPGSESSPQSRMATVDLPPVLPAYPRGWGFRVSLVVLAVLVALGLVGFLLRLQQGFQDRSHWGYYAVLFSYLLATAQAAPLIAVGLRLTRSPWRRPLTRVAELFAVVGLLNLLLFLPLLRLLPSASGRQTIWFGWSGAPHRWDLVALVLVVGTGLALLFLSALPDLAASSPRLASWWHGARRQWRVHRAGLFLLGVFYFMGFVLLQTMISSDLALSLVPGWRDSLFPASQTLSSLQAGVASVTLALFLWRRAGLAPYLSWEPFWGLGRLLLVLSLLWFYFNWSSFIVMWYGRRPEEEMVLRLILTGPYRWAALTAVSLNFLAPFLLLIWNPVRRSIAGPTLAALLVLVGALFDRIRLYASAFSAEAGLDKLPSPHLEAPDVFIMAGGIAAAILLYLLAARWLPVLARWEVAEGRRLESSQPFLRRRTKVVVP